MFCQSQELEKKGRRETRPSFDRPAWRRMAPAARAGILSSENKY